LKGLNAIRKDWKVAYLLASLPPCASLPASLILFILSTRFLLRVRVENCCEWMNELYVQEIKRKEKMII
jgi:hypothetical protein